MQTTIYDIANELINYSNRSIFLTGKAGTGKTTFLRKLKESTSKQMAIVAPTGVAAINAGGTTIHSFFQIAPGTLIPTKEANYQFLSKQQVNSVRRKIFTSLELLVIDEISMVRADLLDLIDIILRHYRYKPNTPFGGVQLMFIGDMHQLPPVCNNEDWQILQTFYQSPFFFHSKVMQELKPVYVEFDKIFRQTNMQFVDLLNNVRNNTLSSTDFELMDKRYIPDFDPKDDEGYILLTTHNAKADLVNSTKLGAINEKVYHFQSTVMGDFPEKNYPAEQDLQLKVGAKVMFIANDKQPIKRYYNGKIGIITHISDEEGIYVQCPEEEEAINVDRESWNNVKYSHDKTTNTIKEEINGTFTQYPLRLAWAITIHKSQGLTFNKVVIDAGSAFSPGQVYVALSRCTTLDGIVLTTRINPHSLAVDADVVRYAQNKVGLTELEQEMRSSRYAYTYNILKDVFGFYDVSTYVNISVNYLKKYKADLGEQSEPYLTALQALIAGVFDVGQRFVRQLETMQATNADNLQERVTAAADYFNDKINELTTLIEASPVISDSKAQADDYVDRMKTIYEQLSLRQWLIAGLKNDCSVVNYFDVKATYRTPKVKLVAYAGATERTQLKTEHPKLYKMLAAERNEICEEIGMPVYFVATTKMLVAMTNLLPQSIEALLKIKGFGKEKAKRFGDRFIDVVNQYCKENGIDADQRFNFEDGELTSSQSEYVKESKKKKEKAEQAPKEKKVKEKVEKPPKEVQVPSIDITCEMLKRMHNIAEVAAERGLAESTVWQHARKLVIEKKILASEFVLDSDIKKVGEYRNSHEDGSLTAIYKYFEGEYSYDILRVISAALYVESGEME